MAEGVGFRGGKGESDRVSVEGNVTAGQAVVG